LTRTVPTPFADLEAGLERRRQRVEAVLLEVMPQTASAVGRAAAYSLSAPGKRLRPVLSLLVAEMLRGEPDSVLPAACAIELVHTASLILDDLPSMDDARLRRGRPACHIAHGEATAILAAFALLNRGFEILSAGWPGAPAAALRQAIAVDLAAAVGLDGMIAGQAADLEMTGRPLDFSTLEFIHSRKTGALFIAAAALGAVAANADAAARQAVCAYAKNLGLAFQIVDDLLDVESNPEAAGKDVGQDLKKTTFVSFAGTQGARQIAAELADASVRSLVGFGAGAEPLRELARYVVARRR
jgi:geranylgeranyl diphosphate synthase type II